jgi:hypothetical protein
LKRSFCVWKFAISSASTFRTRCPAGFGVHFLVFVVKLALLPPADWLRSVARTGLQHHSSGFRSELPGWSCTQPNKKPHGIIYRGARQMQLVQMRTLTWLRNTRRCELLQFPQTSNFKFTAGSKHRSKRDAATPPASGKVHCAETDLICLLAQRRRHG